MKNIRLPDLSVVAQELWPNVGRMICVYAPVPGSDLGAMDLWRLRVGTRTVTSFVTLAELAK